MGRFTPTFTGHFSYHLKSLKAKQRMSESTEPAAGNSVPSPASATTTETRDIAKSNASALVPAAAIQDSLRQDELGFYNWEPSSALAVWNTLLAASACLDFSAAMADNFFEDEDSLESAMAGPEGIATSQRQHYLLTQEAADWLIRHATLLGLFFSTMWFLDAFMSAHIRRIRALRDQDRHRLFLLFGNDDKLIQKTTTPWSEGPHAVYYTTIAIQLLLLPVGFYVMLYSALTRLDTNVDNDFSIQIIHHSSDDDVDDEYEIFTNHANVSLIFAVVKHTLISVNRWLGMHLQEQLHRRIWRLARRLLVRAVRNPFRFSRRVRRTLRTVRWIKYLAPLIGTSNKLRENTLDLLKKHRQHRAAVTARRVRQQLWHDMTEDELREYAAILIQKTVRAHQTRRKVAALALFQQTVQQAAAQRLQAVFRRKLQQARYRIALKQKELESLQKKQQHKQQTHGSSSKQLNAEERQRMYALQKELNDEAHQLINERLLLRPNTSFAVAWKILFVFAVIFEIAQLACKPLLSKYQDNDGNPMQVDTFLNQALLPTTPVRLLEECQPCVERRNGPVAMLRRWLGKQEAQLKHCIEAMPWYCDSTSYLALETVYRGLIHWSIQSFLDIVGFICFLDVFITFFTGDYNDVSGQLEPKPFFKRWVLPGLCLQLLVNPTMETVSDVLYLAVTGLIRRGPFRVLRWTVALFYPAAMLSLHSIRRLWLSLVLAQNKELVEQPSRQISKPAVRG